MDIASVCRIISCILQNENLKFLSFDHDVMSCIRHDAWITEGLALPPDDCLKDNSWQFLMPVLCAAAAATKAKAAEVDAAAEAAQKAKFSQTTEILQRLSLDTHIPTFM